MSPRPLATTAGRYATIFFDYEGRWAKAGQEEASRKGAQFVLEALATRGACATFNCVGGMIDDAPDQMAQIASDGHEIASHTLRHEVVQDWSARQVEQDIVSVRERFVPVTSEIVGFRAPQSRWSLPMLAGLKNAGVCWDAENDTAPEPYVLGRTPKGRLWRMPIRIDDWDFQKRNVDGPTLLETWKAAERAASGTYFAIGFHPWVLAQSEDRLKAFADMLAYLDERRSLIGFTRMFQLCEARLCEETGPGSGPENGKERL
jgi:peptidoglycan/xylan/chitin deacetylase (PgdA/CDA1 family)